MKKLLLFIFVAVFALAANAQNGQFSLMTLPYSADALEPVISKQTIEYHHGKHLLAYVNNLNKLIIGTDFEGKSLEYIVANSEGDIFNNAGQVLNHNLYFAQFSPEGADKPEGKLMHAIEKEWGDFETFKKEFEKSGVSLFGSGWVWLAKDKDGKLLIVQEPNGSNPVAKGLTPLLGFDVWEHSYYLDYHNRRADHLSALWQIVDWKTVGERYEK